MRRVLASLLAIAVSGCATIFHGRYQEIAVSSAPAGASIGIDCGDVPHDGGVTPARVKVRRDAKTCSLTVAKSGYQSQSVSLERVLSPAIWTNLAPGLSVGFLAGSAVAISSFDSPSGADTNTASLKALVVGAAIPAAIDFATGAAYRRTPDRVDVTLQPTPRGQP